MKLTKATLVLATLAGMLALTPSLPAKPAHRARAKTVHHAKRMKAVDRQLNRLSRVLKLTNQQKPKVKALLLRRDNQVHRLRTDKSLSPQARRAKMRMLHRAVNKRMRQILTPQQFARYHQMLRRVRAHRQSRVRNK